MKPVIAFIVLMLLFSLPCLAAGKSSLMPREGDKTWEEKYSDLPTVITSAERDITVNSDGTSATRSHTVIRIQKESGREAGEVSLSYDSSYQELKDISAFTVLPDGKRLNYTKLQELDGGGEDALYSNEKEVIITLPEVNAGVSIERSHVLIEKKPMIEGHYFNSFSWGGSSPAKELRFRISFPEDMAVNIHHVNTPLRPSKVIMDGRAVYTWEINNLERRREEEYAPSDNEVAPYVIISTAENWDVIANWYWKLVAKNMTLNKAIEEKIALLMKGCPTEAEKAEAILQFVRQNFRYVSMSFDRNRYEPHPVTEVFQNKYGDCKDQATLVLAMLKKAGINAWPALYSSESDGFFFKEAPSIEYFDHALLILKADGKTCYVDPLIKGYRIDEIPHEEQGDHLLIVTDRGGTVDTIPLQNRALYTETRKGSYEIRPDGSALLDEKTIYPRNESLEMAEKFETMDEDNRKDFFKQFETSSQGGKLLDFTYSYDKETFSPFITETRQALPHIAAVQGKFLILKPSYLDPDLSFITSERIYPVVFYFNSIINAGVTYSLPAGYRIEAVPEDRTFSTKLVDYTVRHTLEGNRVKRELSLKFKQGRMELSEYPSLQAMARDINQYLTKFIIACKEK